MNKIISIVTLFLISSCFLCAQDNRDKLDYGLFIKSHPASDSQKTTLVLENDRPIKLGAETTMSFDMYIRPDYLFGLVFRIVTDKQENIDLMITVSDDDKRFPLLAIKESAHTISQEIVCNEWIPISITLSPAKKTVSLSYDSTEITVPYDLSGSSSAKISFGVSTFENFGISDIASVNVKDIRISENGALIRYWKLKEHNDNISLDSLTRTPAIVTNPQWIVDDYATWKKIYSKKVMENSLFAFDQKNLFYIISPDSKNISAFDTRTGSETNIPVKGGYLVANIPNMVYYDTSSNQLVTYNLDENTTSAFSFETNMWDATSKPVKEPGYMNNTAVYSPEESTIYSFGGYGFYKYNHDLIKLNVADGSAKKTPLADILPRFSASSAIVDGTLYIFGGRGSKSGRQELSPRNYYDFYSVNLIMGQANKIWEVDTVEGDFLPGENMIYDRERDCFYMFSNQNGGTLLKLSKDKKGVEQMSFPIGESLEAFFQYSNLYYSPSDKKLYALFYKKVSDTESTVSIYSLDFPPVSIADLKQVMPQASNNDSSYSIPVVISIIGIFVLCAIFILISRIRKKRSRTDKDNRLESEHSRKETAEKPAYIPSGNVNIAENNADEKSVIQEQNYYDFSKQAVCLIGGFTVKDIEGNNITGQFTPTLKYLLVLLILYTQKDSRGISGKKIIQLLWFDKEEGSAKKNRNVYLSKLRSIFDSVGGVEIISQNGFWTVKFNEKITCDYFEAMQLFSIIRESQFADQTVVNKLLELLLRGVLLPNTETDWTDNFKSDFSNLTIDVLTDILQNDKYQLDDDMKLKIADTIFLHDFINEEALYLKCSILFNSGKKGIAKSIYDNFCKEYLNLLGEPYKYSLTDVIDKKFTE